MENISNLIVTVVAVIGAISAALIGGLAIWTFRDIRSRSRDVLVQVLATVMVGVIPIAGILVYFMLRPRETLAEGYVRALEEESLLASIERQEFCPSCGRRVDDDMVYCPACHTTLRSSCPNCHRAVHLSWDLCPYCGETLQPETSAINKPARRRVAPASSQAKPSLPPSVQQTNPAIASDDGNATTSSGFTGLLDKVGGAIENLMDRVSSRGQGQTQPSYSQTMSQPEEDTPAVPGRPHSAGDDGKATATAIKPLISREEPLE